MKICILDDEPQALSEILAMVQEYLAESRLEAPEAFGFTDEADFWQDVKKQPPDIAILDIYLGKEPRGMEIARLLKKIHSETLIIFLTSSPDFAIESYDMGVVHYLLKPATPSAVQECFLRCQKLLPQRSSLISLPRGKGLSFLVSLPEICYFQAQQHKTLLFLCHSEEPQLIYRSIQELERELEPGGSFLRVSRSYLVNMRNIFDFGAKSIEMTDGRKLSFTHAFSQETKDRYAGFVFRVTREW